MSEVHHSAFSSSVRMSVCLNHTTTHYHHITTTLIFRRKTRRGQVVVAARDERIKISVLDLLAVGKWKSRAVPRRALAEITALSKAIIGIKVWKGKIVYGITFNGLCALDVYYEYILFCLLVHPDSPVDTGQLTPSHAGADSHLWWCCSCIKLLCLRIMARTIS